MALLFIAIGQFQAVRIVNNLVRYSDVLNQSVLLRSLGSFGYYLSEIVMILCLSHSMNHVLKVLVNEAERLETMSVRPSLFEED